MKRSYYPTGKFAQMASVSRRTLRYYDREGLLQPSGYSEAGYRLYTEDDLVGLEQILALKFLGFSLEEIRALIKSGPHTLQGMLAQQKQMMLAKRAQIDSVVEAIEETERTLGEGRQDWGSVVRAIKAIRTMEENRDWAKNYFTQEQLDKMQELSQRAYSDEAQRKMAERPVWTEEDQKRVDAEWDKVWAGIRRLHAAGADPAGAEAQAVVASYNGLIAQFTMNDPDISAGLNNWWQSYNALPPQERPFQMPLTAEEQEFFDRARATAQ